MSNNHNRNIPMTLASILLCLVLFTTYLTSGLYARYSSGFNTTDEARVIKFGNVEIIETASFNKDEKLVICPGVDITKNVEVFFSGSEAQTYVFVKMDASDDWDYDDNHIDYSIDGLVKFSINTDEWTYVENTNHVYYKELAPNTLVGEIQDNKHIGVDVIKDGKITVDEKLTMAGLDSMTEIVNEIKKTTVNLDFTAMVVQANGFSSVDEALASVENKW